MCALACRKGANTADSDILYTGMNHAAAGCATGLIMGASGGPVPALMQCGAVGALSAYVGHQEAAHAAALPAQRAPPKAHPGRRCHQGCCTALGASRAQQVQGGAVRRLREAAAQLWRMQTRCSACSAAQAGNVMQPPSRNLRPVKPIFAVSSRAQPLVWRQPKWRPEARWAPAIATQAAVYIQSL